MVVCGNNKMKVKKKNDYKSVALPVELQGHRLFCRINSLFIQVIQLKSLYDLKTSLSRNKRSIVLNSY